MELLISRMRVLKTPHWSKIGRLRVNRIPQPMKSSSFCMVDRGGR
jgi:hypothetical protein